jgi:arylsulfate sulfotransferase
MNSRLVARVAVVLSVLSGVTGSGQNVGKLDVSEGPTPFIRFVHTRVDDVPGFEFAEFWIFPKSGSATRPIKARYARSYLEARGYFYPESGKLTIPIFGLYAGRPNRVLINLAFGGRFHPIKLTITTPAYDGGTYSHPTVIQPLLPGTTLSYDFILLKGFADPITPIIIDTDAEIRWVGTAGVRSIASGLFDNAFYLTSGTSLLRTEFDGVTTPVADYSGIGVTGFHHNIDPGREGMILDVDTVNQTESVNLEVDAAGNVLRTWKLADIISAAMIAGGDDPTQFVHPAPTDWFHNNTCTYRSSDNSLIVSSRENFVIALDYDSGNIKWILGDPTKHWHEFSSLRAFALTLAPGTLPPIGEHACLCRVISYSSSIMEPAAISSNRREKHAPIAPLASIRSISVLLRRLRPGIITLTRVSIARSAVAFMKMRRRTTSSIIRLEIMPIPASLVSMSWVMWLSTIDTN